MSWTTPPTFTDTNALSASQLNVLSDDLVYLYGLSSTVNIPFVLTEEDLRTTLDSNKSFWQVRHRAKYLNLYIDYSVDATYVDHLSWTVTYGAWTLSSVNPLAYSPPCYVAFDVETAGAVVGTWYEIVVDAVRHDAAHAVAGLSGSSYFRVLRMFESDTDYS